MASGLIMLGLLSTMRLKPIKLSADIPAKPYSEVLGNTEFMMFNHRGIEMANRRKRIIKR